MKLIDSRFPKTLTDRSLGLRNHPMSKEVATSSFWQRAPPYQPDRRDAV